MMMQSSASQSAAAAPAAAPGTPSPRPDCAQQHVTIYFSDTVQSDQPVATPLLDLMMNNVHACERAGGAVVDAIVATTADAGQSPDAAAAQLQRRQDRVRDTLIHLGIAASKIRNAPAGQADSDAIMGKHADITVDLY